MKQRCCNTLLVVDDLDKLNQSLSLSHTHTPPHTPHLPPSKQQLLCQHMRLEYQSACLFLSHHHGNNKCMVMLSVSALGFSKCSQCLLRPQGRKNKNRGQFFYFILGDDGVAPLKKMKRTVRGLVKNRSRKEATKQKIFAAKVRKEVKRKGTGMTIECQILSVQR